MLKRIQKFEKLDYRLRKAELDLEFLLRCRDSNVIPKLKLLQEEIRHKNIRVLREEFNSSHLSLQHEISFIDFAHVSSLFLRSNNRILALESTTQQKMLSKWVKSIISVQDPSKVIFNFSKYELSDCGKRLFVKGLNFILPP